MIGVEPTRYPGVTSGAFLSPNSVTPTLYVAICGDHGTGKTTLAKQAQQRLHDLLWPHNVDVRIVAMADELRETLGRVTPKPLRKDRKEPLEREALQWYGDSVRRADSNYWVRRWLARVHSEKRGASAQIVIADDVYYLNEAFCQDVICVVKKPRPRFSLRRWSREPFKHIPGSVRQTQMLTNLDLPHPGTVLEYVAAKPGDLDAYLGDFVQETQLALWHKFPDLIPPQEP